MPLLVYVHGLNSSSGSLKAQLTERWLKNNAAHINFWCPDLPPFAGPALKVIRDRLEDHWSEPVYLVGSSMGGFLSTILVEELGLRAALINPAVNPARGLHRWLGENQNYHTGESWTLEARHLTEYQDLDPGVPARKDNYLVLLQTGDEVLDYRDALRLYSGCRIILEDGGDHSFVGYENHLPDIVSFLTAAN